MKNFSVVEPCGIPDFGCKYVSPGPGEYCFKARYATCRIEPARTALAYSIDLEKKI
jgi:hypothetical protein